MKKTKLLLVFALILSANLAFSQSKFSLAVGTKYYNFAHNPVGVPRLFGAYTAAYYDLGKRNKVGAKFGIDVSYPSFLGTILSAKNATLNWRFAFVKRTKISIFIENGLGIRHFNAEKPSRAIALSLSSTSSNSTSFSIRPALNVLNWDRIIGINYHIDKDNTLGLQYESTRMKNIEYNLVFAWYSLGLIYEYHF